MSQSTNGVAFQFFHWFLDKDDSYQNKKNLWVFLKEEAEHLREIRIDAVWIPPAYKAFAGEQSTGYDVYDHFDLGEFDDKGSLRTKYGTKEELHDAINALHGYKSRVAAL
jgi:alpha-amylase